MRFLTIACVAIGMVACGTAIDGDAGDAVNAAAPPASSGADRTEEGDLPTASSPASTRELARVYLGAGKEATFTQIGAGEDIGVIYEEIGPESSTPTFADTPELEALDMFLRVVPADTPVPRALLETLDASARESAKTRLAARKLVDTMTTPIIAAPSLSLRSESHDTGAWDCNQSASDFEDFACDGSNTSSTVDFCDSGKWFNLQRSSGDHKRRKSLGVFVACGTDVQIKHSYADCCNWWKLDSKILPSSHWMWSRYTGLSDRKRRINYDRVTQFSGSYLRAYTAFYN
jgi:hypothetical protein